MPKSKHSRKGKVRRRHEVYERTAERVEEARKRFLQREPTAMEKALADLKETEILDEKLAHKRWGGEAK